MPPSTAEERLAEAAALARLGLAIFFSHGVAGNPLAQREAVAHGDRMADAFLEAHPELPQMLVTGLSR